MSGVREAPSPDGELFRVARRPDPFVPQLPDLDPSTVRGPHRELTQIIAGWAYDRGYQGIVYRSRFDDGLSVPLDCLALFGVDGVAQVRPVGVDPITRDDPDLLLAATQHRLAL